MKRRRLLVAASGLAVLAPALRAQQAGRVYRVALLGLQRRAAGTHEFFLRPLAAGLKEAGFAEGRNLTLDFHTADGDPARLPAVAAEVVRQKYDVIVTSTNEVTAAAMAASRTVPIVMAVGGNPLRAGFIASMARPGGNVTGLTFDAAPEAYAKPLEFLKAIAPDLPRVAVLRSTAKLWEPMWAEFEAMGGKLGIAVEPVDVRTPADIAPAFAAMKERGVRAFVFWPDPITFPVRAQIAELALKERLMSASLISEFAASGGLISYGPNLRDLFRRAGLYAGRILNGARPGDLPVEQPTKYELILNLQTAAGLGMAIPASLRLRADRVIGD